MSIGKVPLTVSNNTQFMKNIYTRFGHFTMILEVRNKHITFYTTF